MVSEGRTESETEQLRPLRIAARPQRKLLCVMAFQEMEWASMGDVDAEIFDLENIGNTQNEIVIPIFDTDEAAPIWSDETEED